MSDISRYDGSRSEPPYPTEPELAEDDAEIADLRQQLFEARQTILSEGMRGDGFERQVEALTKAAEFLRQQLAAEQAEAAKLIERWMDLEAKARAEVSGHEHNFKIRWDATQRGIKRWQEAHPGNDLVWPDHADLCVWLIEQLAAEQAKNHEFLGRDGLANRSLEIAGEIEALESSLRDRVAIAVLPSLLQPLAADQLAYQRDNPFGVVPIQALAKMVWWITDAVLEARGAQKEDAA